MTPHANERALCQADWEAPAVTLRWTGRTATAVGLTIVAMLLLWSASASADADLAIDKTDSADPVQVSQLLTYTLTIDNDGPDLATDVAVTDTLPTSVTYVDASASQGSCFLTPSDTVECDLEDIPNGDSVTVEIEVVPTQPGAITNVAQVSASTVDPDATNDDASEGTLVVEADFRALKRVKQTVQDPVVRYEVELINEGNLAQPDNPSDEFIDDLPEEMAIVPHTLSASSGTIDYDPVHHRVTWNGPIPSNDRVTLEFAVGTETGLIVASTRSDWTGWAMPAFGLALVGLTLATRRRRLGLLVILIGLSLGPLGCSGFWTTPTTVEGPTSLCNQGELHFDADANGTNDAVQPTDDPDTADPQDPTCVIFIP